MRLFKPYLARIEDADERHDEALKFWEDLGEVARFAVKAASQ
jgi:hypothetical protein